ANVLIVIGVALTTGSRLIVMIAIFVGIAYSAMHRAFDIRAQPSLPGLRRFTPMRYQDVVMEASLVLLLVLGILSIQEVKGLLLLFP
ncbi:MAG TPA: hypothetical protein VJ692_12380, partial [Nitrospiraceae bacterium]|nr:hypothetical protein [Nitrospiraceae bacterium]